MATRLSVYNDALRLIGSQPIAALTDNIPQVQALNESFTDVVLDALSLTPWNFAIKTVQINADPAATPAIGYQFAFQKPDDWIATIAASEYPDIRDAYVYEFEDLFKDSAGLLHSDTDTLYLEYISTDFAEEAGIAAWSHLFARYISAALALDIVQRLNQSSTDRDKIEREARMRLAKAKSRDARDEKEARIRSGSWNRAQRGFGVRQNRQRTALGGSINTRQGRI